LADWLGLATAVPIFCTVGAVLLLMLAAWALYLHWQIEPAGS